MQATVHGITGITSPNASGFDLLPVAPRGLVFLPVIPGTQRVLSTWHTTRTRTMACPFHVNPLR
ncbi:Phytanoyl-CoA dioxygenase [Caenorhabditis elegans]|uniref:Phytanoyl-CoA dioxygenase n=1 Tax=Caenorhabditis elegans TaxID=6239 RepID=Q4W515_CAEEL|nr:Phytanoyl-CoA dioxygenase [Caenorhabditis elegans]CCD70289.1 Phytanoyl-CoA dioxygenase [Caenorhabditis elegans]|eukprot:NP_001254054.1 Uncharacterized protein CELE_F42G2.7 [Caenorhabditis elegans]